MPNIFVPVVDQEQYPLMPTIPSRARRWIKGRKATGFWKGGLFCVRLGVEPSAREMQPIAVGVDPGSKQEGIVVVEDIKAKTKPNKRRWNRSFSPLEVGKQWFYEELSKLAPVQTRQGYQTKEVRDQLGLKKTGKKLAEVWEAHCIDAWCLAYSVVGGQKQPDNRRLVCIAPLMWHHRQLHRFEPEKGGSMSGKLSLHDPQTGKRLTQS